MKRFCVVFVMTPVVIATSGCTHMALRKQTVLQQRTTSDIVQQQVMDNVAKISANPGAWPHYSGIAQGETAITDGGSSELGLQWDARSITQEALALGAKRDLQESWGMAPITDPSRLRAMWAVYHYSIYGTLPPPTHGYDAYKQLYDIFGPHWQTMIPAPGWCQITCDREYCEKVHCGCVVGHHCHVHAHVRAGNEFALQQLTFAIMHIAAAQYYTGDDAIGFPTGVHWFEEQQPEKPEKDEKGTLRSSPPLSRPRLGPSKEFRVNSNGFQFVPGL